MMEEKSVTKKRTRKKPIVGDSVEYPIKGGTADKEIQLDLAKLTFLEMGVYLYLKNYRLREIPLERKQGLMENRLNAAEKKLKALGFIEE